MPGIDLHTHSTISDGTWKPEAIAAEAGNIGLSAVALTDHDTIAGLPKFIDAAIAAGVEPVPGVELAVHGPYGSMDLLGLWVPPKSERIRAAMQWLHERRRDRNQIIISRLRSLGMNISYEEVTATAGVTIGRPHIAKVLAQKGYAGSVSEAFRVFLGAQGKAYAPKQVLSPAQALELLNAEGATVILAHPGLYGMEPERLRAFLSEHIPLGLDGLEAFYPDYSAEETRHYQNLAASLGLVVSGGSDFHGEIKPGLRLGKGYGKLFVADSVLRELKNRRTTQGRSTPSWSG